MAVQPCVTLAYETVAEGELEQITDYDGDDTSVGDTPGENDGGTYSLEGVDALLFTIDPETGEVDQQDWFSPSLDAPWDADRDLIYEVTRVFSPANGGAQTREELAFDTIADGQLEEIDAATLDDPVSVWYSLTGPDASIFSVDDLTGELSPQPWFSTGPDAPWDLDRDNFYEVSRIATEIESGAQTQTDFVFEGTSSGVLDLLETSPETQTSVAGLVMLPPEDGALQDPTEEELDEVIL